MSEDLSRRNLLTLGTGLTMSTLAGCLQLQSDEPERSTTSESTPTETGTSSTDTDASTTTSAPVLDSPWTISNEGSDIITHDGTFYLSTWVSRELVAVTPNGTEQWRGDQKGKFKREWLTASDSAVAGCGYGGQVTVFEQSNGEVRWHYTDAEYTNWSSIRPYMDESFLVTLNEGGPEGEKYTILIFNAETGDVVEEIPMETRIEGVTIADDRLYVATNEYLDVYDTGSFDKVTRVPDFECLSIEFRGTEAVADMQKEIVQYTLKKDGVEGTVIKPKEFQDSLHVVTDESLYVETEDAFEKFTRSGDRNWSVEIKKPISGAAVAADTVYVVDDLYQLYAIDIASGDLLVKKTLPPDGLPWPRMASTDETVVVMNQPIQSFRREDP